MGLQISLLFLPLKGRCDDRCTTINVIKFIELKKENHTVMKKIQSTLFTYLSCVCLFRATPTAYGGSQARSQIRAAAAGLHHSHSNQIRATSVTCAIAQGNAGSEWGQGLNPGHSGKSTESQPLDHQRSPWSYFLTVFFFNWVVVSCNHYIQNTYTV